GARPDRRRGRAPSRTAGHRRGPRRCAGRRHGPAPPGRGCRAGDAGRRRGPARHRRPRLVRPRPGRPGGLHRRRRRLRDRRLPHRAREGRGARRPPRPGAGLRHRGRRPPRHHDPPPRPDPPRGGSRDPTLTCPPDTARPAAQGEPVRRRTRMSAPLMTPDLVRLDVAPPGDKHAVIGLMADLIAATGRPERDGLEAGLLKREESFATGRPGGFAIPHCRTEAVQEAALGMLRLAEPVDFGAADGPADLVIGIAAPAGTDDQHLQLLAQLSRALIRPEFLAELRAATEPKEVSDLVMSALDPAPQQASGTQGTPGATTGEAAAEDDAEAAGTAAPAASATAGSEGAPVLLAITSCPTGIAHTYMAAESLETAAKDKGVELHVETQGSGGITPFTEEQIAAASALIFAADVNVSGRERFAGLPLV